MTLSFASRLRIFIPFALGFFLSYLFRVINAVLAPDLAADIGVDPSGLGLLTAAYFIAFASSQIPLGILLDRFGPRVIETLLLVVAAGGAWVFSNSQTLLGLLAGRAMIGLGVSACLMAAFKAYVMWFPRQQLPLINGIQMASGGLGALTAMAPVEAALAYTDWRGMFSLLAVATLLTAAIIFFVVPSGKPVQPRERWSDQIKGIRAIFSSLVFWRVAPWATLSQGSFLAIHSLWAGPWLRDVGGLPRSAAAALLSTMGVAMVAGYLAMGTAAEWLSRRGIQPLSVAGAGMGIFMLHLLLISLHLNVIVYPIWTTFGFFGTSGILVYAALSQSFPTHLAGRVNTALNLMVFVAAFGLQWGIGMVINQWPTAPDGSYAPEGYRIAFFCVLGLQGLSLLWFIFAGLLMRGRPAAVSSSQGKQN